MRFKLLFSFVLLFNVLHLVAQERGSYWDVDYGFGSILKHKKIIGHLVTEHPEVYSVSWFNTAPKESWKKRYNYPDWGLTLIHQRFINPVLGSVTALNYSNNFYLLNRNNKNQFNLGMGLGFGYASNPLDFETNNQNVAISSDITFSVHLKLHYNYPNLYKNIGFHSGLMFTHFSNSSFKNPNFGINSVFVNAGLSYQSKWLEGRAYPPKEKATISKQNYLFFLNLDASVHEVKAGLGTRPILNFRAYVSKQFTPKTGAKLSLDYFHSWAYKNLSYFLHNVNTEYINRPLIDFRQFGVSAGHELYFDKWIFDTNIGYYLYNPLKKTPDLYQILGFRYKIENTKFRIGFMIKVHRFRADYTSLGLHYQIF